MERSAVTIQEQERSYKVFDELASIRMLRSDLEMYGQILPETWQQVYNEELTFVAEGINAPLQTSFTLKNSGEGLVDERGQSLKGLLGRGVTAAENAAFADSRQFFNVKRAVHDYHEAELLQQMVDGETAHNTMVSVSPFAEEAYRTYGRDCVERAGFQPSRLLAFIRIYERTGNNELRVTSVSVDNSNLDAFRFVLAQHGVEVSAGTSSDDFLGHRAFLDLSESEQASLPSRLRKNYDHALSVLNNGEKFNAGRLVSDEVNAWEFISKQKDLVQYYLQQLEALAQTSVDSRQSKRELTYSFWAALKLRLEHQAKTGQPNTQYYDNSLLRQQALQQELAYSFQVATARHERMIGCGGAIGSSKSLGEESPENALSSIMNGESEDSGSEKLKWKSGICRIDGCPTRPGKTLVAQCSVCKHCQQLFDTGKDPIKMYKHMSN